MYPGVKVDTMRNVVWKHLSQNAFVAIRMLFFAGVFLHFPCTFLTVCLHPQQLEVKTTDILSPNQLQPPLLADIIAFSNEISLDGASYLHPLVVSVNTASRLSGHPILLVG